MQLQHPIENDLHQWVEEEVVDLHPKEEEAEAEDVVVVVVVVVEEDVYQCPKGKYFLQETQHGLPQRHQQPAIRT